MDSPLIDLRLFSNVSLANCFSIRFLLQACWVGLFFILSLLFQNIFGYSAVKAGLYFLIISFAVSIFSPLAGKLIGRFPAKTLILSGMLFCVISFLILASLTTSSPRWPMITGFLLLGTGIGFAFPALLHTTFSLAPQHRKGMVSGIVYFMLFSGGSIGAIIVGAILNFSAPRFFMHKLQGSNLHLSHHALQLLKDSAIGVRNVLHVSQTLSLQHANHYIALAQQSFFSSFRVVMLLFVGFALLMLLLTWFISYDE